MSVGDSLYFWFDVDQPAGRIALLVPRSPTHTHVSMLNHVYRQFRPTLQVELAESATHAGINPLFGDLKYLGDLPVCQPAGNAAANPQLPAGQLVAGLIVTRSHIRPFHSVGRGASNTSYL